jgi:hypothetical protein
VAARAAIAAIQSSPFAAPSLPVSSKIAEKTRIGASYNLKTGPVKHRDVRHGFVLGHPMIHAGIFERYFDFVSCLILSFLSAASLANRRSFSRAVFARTAWPAASYSDMAFVASVARSSFLLRPLQLGFGLGALLRMAGHDCTYSASNRDSARHIRLTQAGRQVRFRFYLLLEPF